MRSLALRTWVMLVDRMAQTRPHDVGIHLGGRNIRVAEHGLHAAQIRPAFEEVSGATVPEHVRRQVMENPGLLSVTLDQGPEHLPCHRSAARSYKKIRASPPLLEQDFA